MTIWQEKIARLMEYGKTQAQIAKFCGVQASTIHHLRVGHTTDPSYSVGTKIDEMLEVLDV
jgi:predicted transcriptional regulator